MQNSLSIKKQSIDKQALKIITQVWWPLAASWLMMMAEQPVLSAAIARIPDPEINLAAYGGIVFPLALIIEAPIIMLLSASVGLCKDINSFQKIRKFMMLSGLILTCLHFIVAVTPLYYVVTRQIIGAPEAIIEPARWGLILILPWTWSIAYRRFYQGILIRYGYSAAVGVGTIIRISTISIVMVSAYFTHWLPGVVAAGLAQGLGVLFEAIYAGYRSKPVVRTQLSLQPIQDELTWKAFFKYYIPLAMTSFVTMLWSPICSMALSRMPSPLESLAVWPVLNGYISLFRSFGVAFNEVVVALLDRKGMGSNLRFFAVMQILIMTIVLGAISFTPAAKFLFVDLSALPIQYADIAINAFSFSLIIPCLATLQSWFQGAILFGKQTRGIPEANFFSIGSAILVFVAAYFLVDQVGLYIGMVAYLVMNIVSTIWLGVRSRPVLAMVKLRDAEV
jgi:hypothetical protein